MSTATLLHLLISEDSGLDADAPWSDFRGTPLNSRKMASILRPYGIKPCKVRINDKALQGYRREDLYDSWERYLSPVKSAHPEPTEPPEHSDVPQIPEVPDIPNSESTPQRERVRL